LAGRCFGRLVKADVESVGVKVFIEKSLGGQGMQEFLTMQGQEVIGETCATEECVR